MKGSLSEIEREFVRIVRVFEEIEREFERD